MIAFREHQRPEYKGLRQVPGSSETYPLQDSYYTRTFGTGVRQRGGAAIVQVKASGSYDVPGCVSDGHRLMDATTFTAATASMDRLMAAMTKASVLSKCTGEDSHLLLLSTDEVVPVTPDTEPVGALRAAAPTCAVSVGQRVRLRLGPRDR